MGSTITLFIYWSISVGLIFGGFFALYKGFGLIEMGRGGNDEKNYIKIFKMEAALGSIGSFVMITAFLWGYAAVLALPSYEDSDVLISDWNKAQEERFLAALSLMAARDPDNSSMVYADADSTLIASLDSLDMENIDRMIWLADESSINDMLDSLNIYIDKKDYDKAKAELSRLESHIKNQY